MCVCYIREVSKRKRRTLFSHLETIWVSGINPIFVYTNHHSRGDVVIIIAATFKFKDIFWCSF